MADLGISSSLNRSQFAYTHLSNQNVEESMEHLLHHSQRRTL
jgi:hypothetical protein